MGNERATSWRASATDASSPAVIAWTARFPMAVASTGPARTGRPVAPAVSLHSSRWFDPPPTTWIARTSWPEAAASSSTTMA